jgi:CubicO group peptidase (beta-lactamase class C family)
MPQGIELPRATRRITPVQLASYQSGMPRLPSDVPQGGIEARDIDHYTTADFLNWIAHWTPERELPAPYLYSNASIGLLALLVGQATGGQWFDLMQSRIIGPLGMRDTMLQPSPAQAARLAQGHAEDGTPVPPWPLFAWSAASSLKSTAEDMLAFGEANLGHRLVNGVPPPPSLVEAMRLARQPIYAPEGQDFLQAMGWAVFPADLGEGPNTLVAKSGNTDGFSTVLVFAPAKDLAVFVAANQAKVDVQPLGLEIVRHVLAGDATQAGIKDIPAAALPR